MPSRPTPCYELRYSNGKPAGTDDGYFPHYATEQEALDAAPNVDQGGLGRPVPHQFDAPCVGGPVCAACDITFDEYLDADGITHYVSQDAADKDAHDAGWSPVDGGWRCRDCAPTPAPIPAPGPGQIALDEAAPAEGRAAS